MRKSRRPDKFIWILVGLVVLTLLSAVGARSSFSSTLALEQAPRCGMEEHVHTAECYVGDILVCGEKMHTHSENCYLVLLKDNNVNALLSKVEATADNSLESLIRSTVIQSVVLSQKTQISADGEEGTGVKPTPTPTPTITPTPTLDPSMIPSLMPSPSPSPSPPLPGEETVDPQPITNEDIVQLNLVAAINNVQPRVLLNESLVIQNVSSETMTEEKLLASLLNGGSGISGSDISGSSTYAVEPEDPSTDSKNANIYINLDGEWLCAGTIEFTVSSQNIYITTIYTPQIGTASVLEVINNKLGTTFAYADFGNLYYGYRNANTTGSFAYASVSSSTTNLNRSWGDSAAANAARDLYLMESNSDNPLEFYTVNIVDPDGNTSTSIMVAGQTVALSGDYTWTGADNGTYNVSYDETSDTTVTLASDLTGPITFTAAKRITTVTITYLNADGSTYQTDDTVTSGDTRTVIAPPTGYNAWVDTSDSTTIYKEGDTLTVNGDMTLKAVKLHTVTMIDVGGGTTTAEAIDGTPYKVVSTDLIWTYEDDTELDTALGTDGILYATVTVNRDMTLTAHRARTITYTYEDSSITDKTVRVIDGSSYTVEAPASGYAWFKGGTLFTDSTIASVTENITLTARKAYTVSVQQTPGGGYTDSTYYNGDTFTVPKPPAGHTWSCSNGSTYTGGETVTVSSDLTFTLQAEPDLTVTYDVNFTISSDSGLSAPDTEPTLVGSASDTVSAGGSYTVNSVSDRTVNCPLTYESSRNGSAYFVGWQVNDSGTVIQPGVTLTWEELKAYAGSGTTVELKGVWRTQMLQSVNFFVEYKAGEADIGSAAAYTPAIFTTFVGGIDDVVSNGSAWLNTQYAINNGSDFSVKTPYEWDQEVRGLYGNTAGDIWLAEIPSDAYIFEQLKLYADDLQVPVEGKLDDEGNQVYEYVDVDDLNEYGFAIRWYTFKVAADNGTSAMTWHIDGRLIRKEGKVNTTKTFAGNETLVGKAKVGFYITAVNTPSGAETQKIIIMTITEADDTEKARIIADLQTTMPGVTLADVTKWITPTDDGDGNDNTYLWEFDDIKYNESWIITEHPPDLSDIAKYDEWIVVDSSALGQSAAGQGGTVTVKGVTQATDLEDVEWLRAAFNNIYYLSNSLMLKKEDGSTGQVLTGVSFQFYQAGELITFNYNAEKGAYERASGSTGDFDTLTVGSGYANISLDGFSYDYGDIVIKEVSPPVGYDPVGEVQVGYVLDSEGNKTYGSDGMPIIGITNGAPHAQYHDGLVVIQNNPSLQDVTVEKTWNCLESEKGDVVLQLLANGDVSLTARILTGKKDADGNPVPATVTLTETGGWTYTWKDMPLYANGVKVEYTVRELKIAGESCKSDYSFANWLVVYKDAVTDEDGNITLGVENITPSRPILYLKKTDMLGNPLSGAEFTLVEVDASGNPVADAVVKTATTAADGSLNFDNLRYDTPYRLMEITSPDGYWAYTDPAYLILEVGGTVKVGTGVTSDGTAIVMTGSHTYVRSDTTFTVTVTNRSADKLPETGGGGTYGYYAAGVMLMLLALCVAILPKLWKGRYRMRR